MLNNTTGKRKRLSRILSQCGGSIIVPIDDLLIFGPKGHLADYDKKIPLLKNTPINAIMGFPGVFKQFYQYLCGYPWIMNLTISTINQEHTYKKLAFTVDQAIRAGADAVAIHVNMTSPQEAEMISNLGSIAIDCDKYGIPLMGIMYARKPGFHGDDNYEQLKSSNEEEYSSLVAHCCRVAVEMGVDVIKTNYTGSPASFSTVIKAAGGIPVVVAGGNIIEETDALSIAEGAITAGAAGVCFGRNTFARKDIHAFLDRLSNRITNIAK